jgi:hypothetical protein
MSSKSYWDLFYKKQKIKSFEWLVDNSCLEQLLPQINKSNTIAFLLDVGCGSSLFSSQLKESLPEPAMLLCADFSFDALLRLKSSTSAVAIDFIQCDCKRLPFRSSLFDLAIDKGYLDSVLKQLTLVSANKAMSETLESMSTILEKLDENKLLIQITDEQPELRISLLDEFHFGNSSFEINYSFKEIHVNESIYFAYFINRTKKC